MKRIILAALSFMLFTLSTVFAEDTYGYASIEIYKYQSDPILHTKNGIFKDINVTFSLLKNNDSSINIHNIERYDKRFKPFQANETLQENNTTYWLKVNLGKNFPSGRFIYSYADADFTEHTILPSQKLEKMKTKDIHRIYFNYTNRTDAQIYYFKLVPKYYRIPFIYLSVATPESFFSNLSSHSTLTLIMGILIGIIIMAGIYNATLYYYNKEKTFLYYSLMQFFMVLVLYYYSDAYFWDLQSFFCRNRNYESFITLMTALFAALFSQNLLEIQKYFPKLFKIIQIIILLIFIDMGLTLFYQSLIVEYNLLPLLMIAIIYAGYLRTKQGYKPAYFYLAGWFVLTITVFLGNIDIILAHIPIEPIYIGAVIEALLFSMALSYKMHMISQEKKVQEELLIQQSKLSTLGEMLGNIAHQWRQPLTHLSYIFMNIKEAQKHNELDEAYLNKKIDGASKQLIYLSQTIDDFKDFYAPKKEKEKFILTQAVYETNEIVKSAFRAENIQIETLIKNDMQIHTYKNELKQVILNILDNAKEILIKTETENPKIMIVIDFNTITIEDNGGGIPKDFIDKIFEPYFTTRDDGTGIGLYMSKVIIEQNIKGKLLVKNCTDGACFTIIIPH